MVVKVDLMQLEYGEVIDLINWCIANRIDYDRANDLKVAWFECPPKYGHVWELEIPEEDLTYWLLKWD